jgi:carboxyl-terminal processing protease
MAAQSHRGRNVCLDLSRRLRRARSQAISAPYFARAGSLARRPVTRLYALAGAARVRLGRRALGLVALLGVGLSCTVAAGAADKSPYENLGIFARALSHIELSYVGEVDQKKLIYGAIRGMVRALDPHSDYLSPDEYRVLMSDTRGRFGGVGVEIDVRDGWLTISSVFPNSPAARAHLLPGDRFVSIDGARARDLPIEEAVRRMRGEPGTEVRVSLRRADDGPAVEATLRREVIAVNAVEGRLLDDGHLYVRLRVFQETVARELADTLDAASEKAAAQGGLRGLLLDLRDNPGGLLDQAVLVADEFLEQGTIVSTRGRGGRELAVATARRLGTRPDFPIVVLVNGFTASAAEIVSGALQDHRRALIVGQRTFGKGSVQNIIDLPDQSALKLTIARYYTPSGRSIQAEGIEPDVRIDQAELAGEGAVALSEATLEGHLASESQKASAASDRGSRREHPDQRAARSPFVDDFQANSAYQTLRAISLDRAQRGPAH